MINIELDSITHLPLQSEAEKINSYLKSILILPLCVLEHGSAERAQLIIEALLKSSLSEMAVNLGFIIEPDLSYRALNESNPEARDSALTHRNTLANELNVDDERLLKKIKKACNARGFTFEIDENQQIIHLHRYPLHLSHMIQFNSTRSYVFAVIRFWDPKANAIVEQVCDPLLESEHMFKVTQLRARFGSGEAYIFEAAIGKPFRLSDKYLTKKQQSLLLKALNGKKLVELHEDEEQHLYRVLLNQPPLNTAGDPSKWSIHYDPDNAREILEPLQIFYNTLRQHQGILKIKHAIISQAIEPNWFEKESDIEGISLHLKSQIQTYQHAEYDLDEPQVIIQLIKLMQSIELITFIDKSGSLHGLMLDHETRQKLINHKVPIPTIVKKAINLISDGADLKAAFANLESCLILHELSHNGFDLENYLKNCPILISVRFSEDDLEDPKALTTLLMMLNESATKREIKYYPYYAKAQLAYQSLPSTEVFQSKHYYKRITSETHGLINHVSGLLEEDYYINGVSAEHAAYQLAADLQQLKLSAVFKNSTISAYQLHKSNIRHEITTSFGINIQVKGDSLLVITEVEKVFRELVLRCGKDSKQDLADIEFVYGDFECYTDIQATQLISDKHAQPQSIRLSIGVKNTCPEALRSVVLHDLKQFIAQTHLACEITEVRKIVNTSVLKLSLAFMNFSSEVISKFRNWSAEQTPKIEQDLDVSITHKRLIQEFPVSLEQQRHLVLMSDLHEADLLKGTLLQLAVILQIFKDPQLTLREATSLVLPSSCKKSINAYHRLSASLLKDTQGIVENKSANILAY